MALPEKAISAPITRTLTAEARKVHRPPALRRNSSSDSWSSLASEFLQGDSRLPFKERLKAFASITNLKAGWQAAKARYAEIAQEKDGHLWERFAVVLDILDCFSRVFDAIFLNWNIGCSRVGSAFVDGVFASHSSRMAHCT